MNEENRTPEAVPYIVHEAEVARQERHIKRLWVIIIILIVLITASNGAWLYYEAQFEDITMTQEATTDGSGDAITNGVAAGDLYYYGDSEANNQNPQAENGR